MGGGFVALGTAQLGAAFLKGTIGIALFATRDDADAGFVLCILLSRSSSRRLCDELWSGDEASL